MPPSTPLPSIGLLTSLSDDELGRFRARLADIGLTSERVQAVNAKAGFGIEPMRTVIARFELRRIDAGRAGERGESADLAAYAMRLFFFRDAVTEDAARALLGDALELGRALETGLVSRDEAGGVRSRWCLALVNHLVLVYDDVIAGGDDAIGIDSTTPDLCRASFPEERVPSVLEVGCGAGTAVLLCASRADRAVGVDERPRAVALARLNARLNAVENVELHEGALFSAVAGKAFDLVLSQQPFPLRPPVHEPGSPEPSTRGDEAALRFLRELPPHLAPAGRAIVVADWPVLGGETIEARARAALPQADMSLLLLEAPGPSIDDRCAALAASETRSLGADFEARFFALRSHLESRSVRGLGTAITVVSRARRGPGWSSTVELRPLHEVDLRRARIDRMVAARDMLDGGLDALLAATLRVPEGTRFVEEEGRVVFTLPPDALVPPATTTPHVLGILAAVNRAACVRDAAEALAGERAAPLHVVVDEIAPAVRNALLYGLLELREPS